MRLLRSMQRGDFPLPLHRHPVRQLLVHVVKLINRPAETGRSTRFIKVRAHRGGPLNELADALASEAADSDLIHTGIFQGFCHLFPGFPGFSSRLFYRSYDRFLGTFLSYERLWFTEFRRHKAPI
jgi:hypothetical protein